jgi:hypothetical protein
MTTIKEQILNVVAKRGVSFVELSREVPDFDGDFAHVVYFPDRNIEVLFWHGMSHAAIDALEALIFEGAIAASGSSVLVYAIDGEVPSYPVFTDSVGKSKRVPKERKTYWMPVVFNPAHSVDPEKHIPIFGPKDASI